MITITEWEVAYFAHFMGYDLLRSPDGYILKRDYRDETEIIESRTLEEITEHLKH
jgi:hypothetical protein